MGCGCGRRGVNTGNRTNINRNTGNRLASATPPPNGAALRTAALKSVADKQVALQQVNNLGGIDKNRREVERKRRMMILQKLGRL